MNLAVKERTELESLLSHKPAATRVWERREFDRLCGSRDIVLMGGGGLARRTLAGLRKHGVEPVAIADNAREKQGTMLDGVRVVSPETAARHFGTTAAFVVTIWGANSPHRFAQSRAQLTELGCDVVTSFPQLFWKYAETLLPFYLQDLPSRMLEERAEVLRGFDLWEDDPSRQEYVSQVRFRFCADFDGLAHPVEHPQYFPGDLFTWSKEEWIVDGGAYDGDTIRSLSRIRDSEFGHVLAVEPDPQNFARLDTTVRSLSPAMRAKIECRPVALAASAAMLFLDATGTASSTLASSGTTAVQAEALDTLVGTRVPTFIKLDLEGFELKALEGARQTIERHAPVVAVCVYHRQNHLWKIPLWLRVHQERYAFFLRPHNEEGWDLVCYAVPRARLKDGGR